MSLELSPMSVNVQEDLLSQSELQSFLEMTDREYLYWTEMKYKKGYEINNLSKEEVWSIISDFRYKSGVKIRFGDYLFLSRLTSFQSEKLQQIESSLEKAATKGIVKLVDEAISSSQLEGANITTKVAKKMLNDCNSPVEESQQMIFNNVAAMKYIVEHAKDDLTIDMISDIQSIIVLDTSSDYKTRGFRKGEVYVSDTIKGEVVHYPPRFEKIERLTLELCDFANTKTHDFHPIVKASIIHYMIAYIHPYSDGNGRTARALFYWFLIKSGYDSILKVSISEVILKRKSKYYKSFQKTEYGNHDLNYFINEAIDTLCIASEYVKEG
ncbi:Fic family protein [Aureibacter tunicatorum]|uniref:Fic family protein n=1 Tax=Aureibacter tunicatorum TaxID=866807 RepID=A0AAE4BVJ1_9BACT|nr:Fic family protein [Aureibacter tunicatorum]MDR6241932.1 Fic family protein [Aureibacter tunicatorum]BDD07539.1 transposase [Aureibacter tunicatorum]